MNYLVYIPGHGDCVAKHVGSGHFLRFSKVYKSWFDCNPAEDYACQLQVRVAILNTLVERLLGVI